MTAKVDKKEDGIHRKSTLTTEMKLGKENFGRYIIANRKWSIVDY